MMTFDKRLTLALVVSVALETAAGLVWAGKASERLDQVEARSLEAQAAALRLERLEAQLEDARASLARIEARLDAHGRRG